ncbi:MAG: MoxR family ATPase [Micromonosporaceae bacterium]|nr:MoxR family ATPase [Micromonosporaceae bacterium]
MTSSDSQTASGDRPAWWIFQGSGTPHNGIGRRPAPPPWRDFANRREVARRIGAPQTVAYQVDRDTIELVNAAIYLRRPLLVTGKPGTGKSTLAYSIAHELGLDSVLRWQISSHSTLTDGLYRYDAIGRLQQANLDHSRTPDIGDFLRLGPLGTALAATGKPRVLLIDEIDKSDIDLPGDLLGVFEDGCFDIPELQRLRDAHCVEVMSDDHGARIPVTDGRVLCKEFPIVVLTSNGEREFPAAFLRRCIRLDLKYPDYAAMNRIIAAHFDRLPPHLDEYLTAFFDEHHAGREVATDQLLNAIYLAVTSRWDSEEERHRIRNHVLRALNPAEP